MKCRILEVFLLCFALVWKANAQAPIITSEPQSATNNIASAADFTVAATNAAAYQWFFQATNILSGETNATLSLDDLSTNQAGSYTVVVTSSNSIAVTSAPPAVLTIVPGTIIQWTISKYADGSSSNFLVQLFDHDKPATVENFIHYITAGAYSNMFFDRDYDDVISVLQGGDYVILNQTTNGLSVTNISPGTNFPSQVDNEFGTGPLIHNRFGTIAMALQSGNTNSATSAFYFNLIDDSSYLDSQDFTVFGRVLYGTNSGSNVLQYFNTLSAPTNGIYDYTASNASIPTLPVNYDGTNAPTDSNLFYCGFTFVTGPPVDTTPPTVSITSPTPNVILTNVGTAAVAGAASDNVGLAEVFCVLTAKTGLSAGQSQTNAALGTTNWSLTLSLFEPGLYQLIAYAQDGAGNLSVPVTNYFTSSNNLAATIIAQPPSVSALVGSSAELSVTASNAATYQWLAGTNPIAGATNATLILSDVSTNQSGSSYEVIVTAADGESVTSAPPAVLTVVPGTLVQITFGGFPAGVSNTVIVQLFDHEKPATVANFLHYITPASYYSIFGLESNQPFANMIWDRCIPNFVLQGGAYDAPDQTNGVAPPDLASTLSSISSSFTENFYYTPQFADQVDNEFDAGPVISNTFGTLAMAKSNGNPDSARSAFFFNLADNSANLDYQNGGFTVFGRLLPGSNYLQYSNVLQYFNTLSKPNRGIFDSTAVGSDQSLPDLPVNYHGWGLPADSNLFFGNFTVLSTFNADTTPPTVALSFPTNGQTMATNVIVVQGTASDNVAVANVYCTCNGSNFSRSIYASGTTNWIADFGVLPPGTYTNAIVAQDGAGNFSAQASSTFVAPRFPFEAATNGNGTILATNLNNGTNIVVGSNYTITAAPGKGAVFLNWASGTNAYLSPTQSFAMPNGLQLTAQFISNTAPRGISITYPEPKANLTNGTFSIQGKVAADFDVSSIACQVFSASTSNSVSAPMLIGAANVSATKTWAMTNSLSLAPGGYILQAVALAADGQAAVISEPFNVLTPLNLTIYGPGAASIPGGTYLALGTRYTIVAEPARGQEFLSWNLNGVTLSYQVLPFVMTNELSLAVTFVSNTLPGKLTLTSPKANAQLTNTLVTLSGKITDTDAPQVVCQLFNEFTPVTGFMPATNTGTTWQVVATNLTMGAYTAVAIATDASGHTTLASAQFAVNFYPNIAGTYHGVFFNPDQLSQNSAGYISFKLNSSGVVAGNLTFPARNYPFAFPLGYSSSGTLLPNEKVNPALTLTMAFDVTNFSGQMTGIVTNGSEVSPLTAYRAASKLSTDTTPAPGHYVLSLEPATPPNEAPSNSFAAVLVSANGNLAVAGTLADDTPFSLSTGVGTNGAWPVYAGFDNGNGMLVGWQTNLPSGAVAGSLYWLKSPGNGLYETNGVNEHLSSAGTNYVQPAPADQYKFVFGGGALASTLVTNFFSFSAAGAVVPASGTADKLAGSLVMTTGVLKGSIVNPVDGKTLDFSGALLSPSEGGSGFTLEAGSSPGYFQIIPVEIAVPDGGEGGEVDGEANPPPQITTGVKANPARE